MLIKVLRFVTALSLLGGSLAPASAAAREVSLTVSQLAGAGSAQASASSPLISGQVIAAGETSLSIRFNAPAYQEKQIEKNGEIVTVFDVPGAIPSAQPGQPVLPVYSVLVGIPPAADYHLALLSQRAERLPQRVTLATAEPETRVDPESGALLTAHPVPDSSALENQASAGAVRIASEAWVRDQRILRLEYTPIQADPNSQQVNWSPEVVVELLFVANPAAAPVQPIPQAEIATRRHDPFEKILQSSLLNYAQASDWRAAPQFDLPTDFGFTQAGDFSPAVQIVVDHDAVYRLTFEALSAAGMDISGDPANFQLTSQGQLVAYTLSGDGDASFEPGEAVIFYGQGFKGDHLANVYAASMKPWSSLCPTTCKLANQFEDYTNDNVYWLTIGSTPGLKMPTVDGTPQDTAVTPTSFPYTAHIEEEHRWYPTHLRDEEVWFWAATSAAVTNTFSGSVYGISTDAPTVVISGTMIPNAGQVGAHTAKFYLNSYKTPIASVSWNYVQRYTFRGTVPVTATLNNALNVLKMRTNHSIYFDWFEIAYARQFQAQNNLLQFRYPLTGTFQYQVKGLSGGPAVVLDITNPLTPTLLTNPRMAPDGGTGTYQAAFQASQAGAATYIVAGSAGLQSPRQVSLYTPPNLTPPGNGADYLFITHKNFMTATNSLAAYRQSQGLSTFVVDAADVYRQFNYGIYHSVALRNYIAYAMSSWQVKPTYVLLVGDGHLNFKSNSHPTLKAATASSIYMPPNMAFIDPWQGQTDSTSLLAMVVGTDPVPDVYIGRLPVNSNAQAMIMVNKTIAYEQSARQDWQKNLTYVADDPDVAGDFNLSVNQLVARYSPPDFNSIKILRTDYNLSSPATRAAISRTVNVSGTLFMTYIGHAGINFWAESIMSTALVTATMKNAGKLPVLLSLDCLDGFWHFPEPVNNSSLTETMVRIPNGGAVAAFSPTGLGLSNGHDILADGYYDTFFAQDTWELAPAALNARLAIYTTGWYSDLLYTYSILGDPALRVQGYLQRTLFVPRVAR